MVLFNQSQEVIRLAPGESYEAAFKIKINGEEGEGSSYSPGKKNKEIDEILKKEGYEWTPLPPKDKVVKWQLPVEVDGASGEYYVMFPDDLLEAANLQEGDQVEWVDQGDGSYLLRKVNV